MSKDLHDGPMMFPELEKFFRENVKPTKEGKEAIIKYFELSKKYDSDPSPENKKAMDDACDAVFKNSMKELKNIGLID